MWDIQLFKLNFDHLEMAAVSRVLSTGWLSMGEETNQFETRFSNFLGNSTRCRAVSNGTAALHMGLLALDVGEGDEVIIPSLTFVADINVVTLVGASPVLCDVTSLDDWNMPVDLIEKKITDRTKAVIVVHYAGYPCKDILEISKLCREKGIGLIEDVAHAPGASAHGIRCGAFGDVGCFSFFSNKNLSVGEGGMVVSKDEDIYKKLGYLRSHGMTTLTMDRHKGRAITYDVAQPGLNYRMDEIRAAIGTVQLEKLPAGNGNRRTLTERYRSNLNGSSVEIPFSIQAPELVSAYHILPTLLPSGVERNAVIEALKRERIQTSIHYPPFWDFTTYRDRFSPRDAPIAAEVMGRELTLPLYPTMTTDEVDKVCAALKRSIN